MNWTEGNLARHSRGRQRNKLAERQKQHFAKARNSLLHNATKQSPMTIPAFDRGHTGDRQRQTRAPGVSSRHYSGPSRHEYSNNHPKEQVNPSLGATLDSRDHIHSFKTKQMERHLSSEMVSFEKKRPRDSELDSTDDDHSGLLLEKKRRLLGRADWVGLSMQQPLEIVFPGQWDLNDGPRWSKAVENQSSRRTRKVRHFASRSPTDDNIQGLNRNLGSARQHDQGLPLRIQIGSQEIQPSATTASQASIKRYSLAPRTLHGSSSHFPGQPRQFPASRPSKDVSATKKLYLPSSDQLGYEKSRQTTSSLSDSVKAPLANEGHLPQIVYSSSVIHEPAPRRANDFMVLQWSPSTSEKAESIQVQVGKDEPVVPASQKAENEMWKRLLTSSDRGSESMTQGSSHDASLIGLPLSPGVSALPSNLEVHLPPLDPVLQPSSPWLSSSPITSRGSLETTSLANLSKEPLNGSPTNYHSESYPTQGNTNSCKEAGKEIDKTTQHPLSVAPAQESLAQPPYEEEQYAWKKFVFDSDEDELESRAFQDAAKQAAYELKPSDTSNSTDDLSLINNISASDGTHTNDYQDCETEATCGTTHTSSDLKYSDEISSVLTSDESHVATQGTSFSGSDSESSTTANNLTNARVSHKPAVEPGFRFAHPKKFIGKFVDPKAGLTTQAPPFNDKKSGRGKGKGKQRAPDGRPNIREFPDFDDDPIEEFDWG